ncbi:MAG: hypothetical protein JSS96_01380 [Bacteroidetes bacterium]|nr:hypothetical protein [Bacteroidota bacterium]
MRQCLLFVLAFSLVANLIYAQARVRRYTAPLAGTVDFDKVGDKYNATISYTEMPEPDAADEQEKLDEVKKESSRLYPHISRHVAYFASCYRVFLQGRFNFRHPT